MYIRRWKGFENNKHNRNKLKVVSADTLQRAKRQVNEKNNNKHCRLFLINKMAFYTLKSVNPKRFKILLAIFKARLDSSRHEIHMFWGSLSTSEAGVNCPTSPFYGNYCILMILIREMVTMMIKIIVIYQHD